MAFKGKIPQFLPCSAVVSVGSFFDGPDHTIKTFLPVWARYKVVLPLSTFLQFYFSTSEDPSEGSVEVNKRDQNGYKVNFSIVRVWVWALYPVRARYGYIESTIEHLTTSTHYHLVGLESITNLSKHSKLDFD